MNAHVCVEHEKRVLKRSSGCFIAIIVTIIVAILANLLVRLAVGQFDD